MEQDPLYKWASRRTGLIIAGSLLILMANLFIIFIFSRQGHIKTSPSDKLLPGRNEDAAGVGWSPPDTATLSNSYGDRQIRYGRELIAHTAVYLGPHGKIQHSTNGMNCQNCHLDGGTKIFGNNFSAVAATYPKFRSRSGTIEKIEQRVNDCLKRSLNGKRLSAASKEMNAITSYIMWLGKDVPKGKMPRGSGAKQIGYLDVPADSIRGSIAYKFKCASCHGRNGEGMINGNNTEWIYPPLWGNNSYNTAAGIFAISQFAKYIKCNMPFGATVKTPLLTDQEAWDLAAFVNSMPRPRGDLSRDWPDISKKAVDHPFGPFADEFTERQHKFGPFKPILTAREK